MNENFKPLNLSEYGNLPLRIILAIHEENNTLIPLVHALKLTYQSRGELEIIDVRTDREALEHIGVREVYERWGILTKSSHRSDVAGLGVKIKKVVKTGNKRQEIEKRIRRYTHDLLVIGTKSRETDSVLSRDLADYLAEFFNWTTLLIPYNVRPFVDAETGNVSLNNILIPVENSTFLNSCLIWVRKLLMLFPELTPRITGFHAGRTFPLIYEDEMKGLRWETEVRSDSVVNGIIESARRHNADMIIMGTGRKHSIMQKIMGSRTERVLRRCSCPVLSVKV